MTLSNGYGQRIKPEWLNQSITLDSIHANLQGLERLTISRARARKLFGHVPKCGYEILCKEKIYHANHSKRLYLVNVSNSQYYFWVSESVCFECHCV